MSWWQAVNRDVEERITVDEIKTGVSMHVTRQHALSCNACPTRRESGGQTDWSGLMSSW